MSHPAHISYINIVRMTARALLGRRGGDAWLAEPNERLGGVTPLLMASEARGAARVASELSRMGKAPHRGS